MNSFVSRERHVSSKSGAMTILADDQEEYDSGHESMEALERPDLDDIKKDLDQVENDREDDHDEYEDKNEEDGNSTTIIIEPVIEESAEMVDSVFPTLRLPYHDLVSVIERSNSISNSRAEINQTEALIRSTTFSLRPDSILSSESLAYRPRPVGLLRRALTLSHASSLAQAGGEFPMGSLADVYHSIQSLRNVKKVEHPSAELPEKSSIIRNYAFACIGQMLIMMGFLPHLPQQDVQGR